MTWRPVLLALSFLSLTACQNVWTRVDAEHSTLSNDHYHASLPLDWVFHIRNGVVYATRDGISVQQLVVEVREHAKAFIKTERESSIDMLPSELADHYIAELRAADDNGLPSLELISNQPTQIAGRLGFALHLRFLNGEGLRYERLVKGFADENGLFLLSFQAPTLHFFARDRGAFDMLVDSFTTI